MKKVLSKKSLIIVVVIGVIIGLVYFLNKPNNKPQYHYKGDIDTNSEAYSENPIDDQPISSGIKIPGYPTISLKKKSKEVDITLLNPKDNPCYFTYEIFLKSTGESLYQSKMIAPGYAINHITLNKSFNEGQYEGIITIKTYSTEDGSSTNGANIETILVVN